MIGPSAAARNMLSSTGDAIWQIRTRKHQYRFNFKVLHRDRTEGKTVYSSKFAARMHVKPKRRRPVALGNIGKQEDKS